MLKATAGILFYSPVGEQEEVVSQTAQGLPKTPLLTTSPSPVVPRTLGTLGHSPLPEFSLSMSTPEKIISSGSGVPAAALGAAVPAEGGQDVCAGPWAAPSPTPIPLRAAEESPHPLLSGGLMENPDCTPQPQLPVGAVGFGIP